MITAPKILAPATALFLAAATILLLATMAASQDTPPPPEPPAAPADLPAPGGEAGWLPLDLSKYMNRDAIQTPNEWMRSAQLHHEALLAAEEASQPPPSQLRLTINNLFGDHSIARWSSTSYHVRGQYPRLSRDADGKLELKFIDQQQGLPHDGRIGPFRLYMDELESPDWSRAVAGGKRLVGRNVIRFGRWQQDSRKSLELAPGDQRKYRALNLLFAAEYHHCRVYVRLSAEYADGHQQIIYQGELMDYIGRATWNGDRREYDQPDGQVEYYKYLSKAGGYQLPSFSTGEGAMCLNAFERPLKLDGGRVLKALHIDSLYEVNDKIVSGENWGVLLFAAIALPQK